MAVMRRAHLVSQKLVSNIFCNFDKRLVGVLLEWTVLQVCFDYSHRYTFVFRDTRELGIVKTRPHRGVRLQYRRRTQQSCDPKAVIAAPAPDKWLWLPFMLATYRSDVAFLLPTPKFLSYSRPELVFPKTLLALLCIRQRRLTSCHHFPPHYCHTPSDDRGDMHDFVLGR